MPNAISLPLIDLTEIATDPTARRIQAQRLVDAFTEFGFCLLKGIDGYDEDELLKWTKWFFEDVSVDMKMDQLGINCSFCMYAA